MTAKNQTITDEQAALTVARALADPQRYRIMKILAQASASTPCSMLFDAMKLAPATLSHHMKELRDAGLIVERRTGRTVQYRVRSEVIEAFLDVLEQDFLSASDEGNETICDLPKSGPSIR